MVCFYSQVELTVLYTLIVIIIIINSKIIKKYYSATNISTLLIFITLSRVNIVYYDIKT
jgi:hypothetical protein